MVFQRLSTLDLLDDLILDREKVHQDPRRTSTNGTVNFKTEKPLQHSSNTSQAQKVHSKSAEEDLVLAESSALSSHLGTKEMTISKPKVRPAKVSLAKVKSAQRSCVIVIKKRSPPASSKTERAPKVQRRLSDPHIEDRVNGRSASTDDAYFVSDDENHLDQPDQNGKMDNRTPSHQMLEIDSSDYMDNGTPRRAPVFEGESSVDHKLIVARIQATHVEELECVRQQLDASVTKLKQTHKQHKQDALEAQRQQSVASDKLLADLREELEAEKCVSCHLSWECEDWRRKSENAKDCLEREAALTSQRNEYERLCQEGKCIYAEIVRSCTKNEESICKENEMVQEVQQLAKQIDELKFQVMSLESKDEALRASALSQASQNRSSISPAPSQLSGVSDHKQRLANVRKTYIKVKKKYDNLYSVAANISIVTRLWSHSNFGQFGQYLKQLEIALDESNAEE